MTKKKKFLTDEYKLDIAIPFVWKKGRELLGKLIEAEKANKLVDFAETAWKGDKPLWLMFWVFGVGVGFFYSLILLPIFVGLFGYFAGPSFALLLFSPYALWNAVSTWNCAPNVAGDAFGVPGVYFTWAARGLILLSTARLILSIMP